MLSTTWPVYSPEVVARGDPELVDHAADRHPFRASRALAHGDVTRGQLRARCTRVLPDVWVAGAEPPTPLERARAAWCWCGGRGVLAGWSAAAVHGARWLPDGAPAEVVLDTSPSRTVGLRPWRWELCADEVEEVDGLRLTTLTRTAFDLGRRLPLPEAVAAVDHLCWMAVVAPPTVLSHDSLHPGTRGVRTLRRVVDLADTGAQSPWESRTRLALVLAGLPRPDTQVEVRSGTGRFVARADMGWPQWRVAVEYDGQHHRDAEQFQRDVLRRARLVAAGWTVVSVTASDLAAGAPVTLAGVSTALYRAGAPL